MSEYNWYWYQDYGQNQGSCGCRSHKGKRKKLFRSEEEAERCAERWKSEGHWQEAYECPHTDGWHLRTVR